MSVDSNDGGRPEAPKSGWVRFVAWTRELKPRLKVLYEKYGWSAIGTYLFFWVMVAGGFVVLTSLGIEFESTGGQASVAAGAWVALKLTQIPRTALTLLLTPAVAQVRLKFGRDDAEVPEPSDDAG